MSLLLGFSTGALFRDDLSRGVDAVRSMHLEAIELSALRTRELTSLLDFVEATNLNAFRYISLHAPTDFLPHEEREVVRILLGLSQRHDWPVVVHPDCMNNFSLWEPFGEQLCIENMDKRKPVGRTVEELRPLFEAFPPARLCFDLAHAHQVDTSMTEAYRILREFGTRIRQLHVSEVASNSKHDRISKAVLSAFLDVSVMLPRGIPVILETPVALTEAGRELRKVAMLFEPFAVAAARA
jgi:sugar phosphate isomerase/epimerase